MPPEVWPVAESVAVDGANPMAPVVVVVDVVVVLVTAFVGVELLACGEVAAVWAPVGAVLVDGAGAVAVEAVAVEAVDASTVVVGSVEVVGAVVTSALITSAAM